MNWPSTGTTLNSKLTLQPDQSGYPERNLDTYCSDPAIPVYTVKNQSNHRSQKSTHDNIEPELTLENWEDKAIVRAGLYIWVTEAQRSTDNGDEERCYSVQIYSDRQGRDREKDFTYLNEAVDYANGLGDTEGEWPGEIGSTTYITMSPGFGAGPVTIEVPMGKERKPEADE